MEITLNNNKEVLEFDVISIADLIRHKNYTFHLLVTRLNGRLVRKEERDTALIRDGDRVQILHMISGG